MNLTHPVIVGSALCAGAFVLGTQIHGPADAQAKQPVLNQNQRCVAALEQYNYQAGDLCDTLPPNTDVSLKQWSAYNKANGWTQAGSDCWNTASTTDVPYVLCWNGQITRH